MASEWRPIDTAPRDETSVDLWVIAPDRFEFRIPDAWFCPSAGDWLTSEANYGEPGPCAEGYEVTHWMHRPLPPAPTGDA